MYAGGTQKRFLRPVPGDIWCEGVYETYTQLLVGIGGASCGVGRCLSELEAFLAVGCFSLSPLAAYGVPGRPWEGVTAELSPFGGGGGAVCGVMSERLWFLFCGARVSCLSWPNGVAPPKKDPRTHENPHHAPSFRY